MTPPADSFTLIFSTSDVDTFGSWEAAGLFRHIAFRCNHGGSYIATRAKMREEVRLSERKLDRALRDLREGGWIEGVRADPKDATLTWRVLRLPQTDETSIPREADRRNVDGVSTKRQPLEVDETSITLVSKQVNRTTNTQPQPIAAAPGRDVDLFGAPIEEEHPKPGDVVASWHAGQRDAGEERAHPAVAKRVAGRVKDLARECVTPEDWRRLMDAGYQAGLHGRWDISEFLVNGQPQQSRFARPQSAVAMWVAGGWGGDVASQTAHNGQRRQTR